MPTADPRTPSPPARLQPLSQHLSSYLVSVMEIIIFHSHCYIPAPSGLLSLQLPPVVPLLRQPKIPGFGTGVQYFLLGNIPGRAAHSLALPIAPRVS